MIKYEVHRLDMKDFSLPSIVFGKDLKHSTANALAESLGAGASDRYIFRIVPMKETLTPMTQTMSGREIDDLIAQLYKFHGPAASTNSALPVYTVLQELQKARNAYWEKHRAKAQSAQNQANQVLDQNYYQAAQPNSLPGGHPKYDAKTMLELRKEALLHARLMSPHAETSKAIALDADIFAQFLYGNIVT